MAIAPTVGRRGTGTCARQSRPLTQHFLMVLGGDALARCSVVRCQTTPQKWPRNLSTTGSHYTTNLQTLARPENVHPVIE